MMIPKSPQSDGEFYGRNRLNRLGVEVSQRAEDSRKPSNMIRVAALACGGPLVNLDGEALG
jgi:hypothetical protein